MLWHAEGIARRHPSVPSTRLPGWEAPMTFEPIVTTVAESAITDQDLTAAEGHASVTHICLCFVMC
jgi:hypothetical protein